MAAPEIIEDVTFRAHNGSLFAYDGERLIGQVTSVDGGIHVRLMGRKFRNRHIPPNEEAMALRSVSGEISRLTATVADLVSKPAE